MHHHPPYTSNKVPSPSLHFLLCTTTLLTPPTEHHHPPYTSFTVPSPSLHFLLCTTTLLTPPTERHRPPCTSTMHHHPPYTSHQTISPSLHLLPSTIAFLLLLLCSLILLMPPTKPTCLAYTVQGILPLPVHPRPPYASYHALVSLYFIHLQPLPQHLSYAPQPPLSLLPCSCFLVLHPPSTISTAPWLCTLAPLMPPTMLLCPCTSSTSLHFCSTLSHAPYAMHPHPLMPPTMLLCPCTYPPPSTSAAP